MTNEFAVPLPSQVLGHLPETRAKAQMQKDEIRNIVTGSDKAAREIFTYCFAPGKAGNRQMDQAIVADRLINFVDEDGKPSMLSSYDGLTHKEVWHLFTIVMAGLGYISQGGYFLRHAIVDNSGEDQEAA